MKPFDGQKEKKLKRERKRKEEKLLKKIVEISNIANSQNFIHRIFSYTVKNTFNFEKHKKALSSTG
jgi:hypothetical protein